MKDDEYKEKAGRQFDSKRNLLPALLTVALSALVYACLTWLYYDAINSPASKVLVPVGGDFINIWTASHQLLIGKSHMLYDYESYLETLRHLFAPDIEPHNYGYPPFFLFLIFPFALFPYHFSYALWCVGTLVLFILAVRRFGTKSLPAMLMLIFAPASYVNIIVGQNGFLSAALLIGGFALLRDRPLLAGVLFGLLTYKPHLGIFIPLVLLLARQWRAFLSASVVTIMLLLAGLAVFGAEFTLAYFQDTAAFQRSIMEKGEGAFQYMMPSAFMAVRTAGGALWLGYGLSAILAVLSLIAIWRVWCCGHSYGLQVAVLILATLLALPYAFNYDMTISTFAMILIYPHVKGILEKLVLVFVWLSPLLVVFINAAGFPAGPFILAAALLLALRCAYRARKDAAAAPV